jgi:hypothetical protein
MYNMCCREKEKQWKKDVKYFSRVCQKHSVIITMSKWHAINTIMCSNWTDKLWPSSAYSNSAIGMLNDEINWTGVENRPSAC